MADTITAAGAGLVAEQHDLRLGQFHARRAGRDRRIQIEVFADLLGLRHRHLAKRHRNPERGGAVGDAHGIMDLARQRLVAGFRVAHRLDGQERRLGLDVMHVLRIRDSSILHRRFDGIRNLRNHRRTADVLRQ